MKKPMLSVGHLFASAGLLFAGYVFFCSLPDLRRYIRISTMLALSLAQADSTLLQEIP